MPTAKRNTIAYLLKITLNLNFFKADNVSCGNNAAGNIVD
jgi:hypothetical protein